MGEYKKITFFIHDEVYKEIEKILHYRYARVLTLDIDAKSRSTEEFVKGCVMHYLKQIKKQEILAGIDDLGKPFRLRNKFKELMIKKGLKQKDIAEAIQIAQANISNIFNNENQPSLDYFLRLWVFFGCPPLNEVLYREEG